MAKSKQKLLDEAERNLLKGLVDKAVQDLKESNALLKAAKEAHDSITREAQMYRAQAEHFRKSRDVFRNKMLLKQQDLDDAKRSIEHYRNAFNQLNNSIVKRGTIRHESDPSFAFAREMYINSGLFEDVDKGLFDAFPDAKVFDVSRISSEFGGKFDFKLTKHGEKNIEGVQDETLKDIGEKTAEHLNSSIKVEFDEVAQKWVSRPDEDAKVATTSSVNAVAQEAAQK